MVCKNCGNQMPNGKKYCDMCGSKMEGNICSKCGAVIKQGSKFCGNCGTYINENVDTSYRPHQNTNTNKSNLLVSIIVALIIICVVAALFGTYFVYSKYIATGTDEMANDVSQEAVVQDEEDGEAIDNVVVEDELPTDTPNTTVIATYYVVNCDNYVTLRSAPSTSSAELAKLYLGQAVGYIENSSNGFVKVNYDGKIGYVLFAYLSSEKPSVEKQDSNTYSHPVFTQVDASSTRESMRDNSGNLVNYSPKNVLDGDYSTCWAMDITTGIVPSITLRANEKQYISGIKFSNGYFKSEYAYNTNRKITRVEIVYDGGSREYTCSSNQYMVLQDIRFNSPVSSSYITIRVLESTAATYDDVCISTIEVY